VGAALLVCLWVAGGAAAAAQEPLAAAPLQPPGGWLERLQKRLDGIRSFKARFTQEYEPRGFGRRQREGGTVLFRKPGKMRWEYEWPEKKLAVTDGRKAWVYYPDEKRLEVDALAEIEEGTPALQLLLGRWKLLERFRLDGISRREDAEVTLHLTPEPAIEVLHALRITLRESDLTLLGVEAEEPGGNLLRYRFEAWAEGAEWDEELFKFSTPEPPRP